MNASVKKTLTSVKNNVKNHKAAYVFGAIAIGAIALQQSNVKSFTAFLEEKGIDPTEYFCPEYFEELQNS